MDDSKFTLQQIWDLLFSAGYVDAAKSDIPSAEKLTGGLAWCIAAIDSSDYSSEPNFSHGNRSIIENAECIKEALQLVGCPHPLQLSQIQNLNIEVIFPVIQWLVMRLRSKQEVREVVHLKHPDENDGQHSHQQLMQELEKTKISIKNLNEKLVELNLRKLNAMNELGHLKERIDKEGADAVAQKLISLMKSLKDLERQEIHFCSNRDARHSELQDEVRELEGRITNDCDTGSLSDGLHNSLCKALERLHLDKKELAGRLRDIVAIKRQIDDLPCQSELIQYEHRFSELNAQIQGKHQQTRKYYATYNALLERKELMLKETSLLNSIISQFQEAFSSADGRLKLMNSMEGIVKGSQQKLGKVQLGLQEEEKIRNDLKQRYVAAVGTQKRSYSLLKAFQEECKKNEKLQCQSSK